MLGLTEQRVRTSAEARFRSARIYDDDPRSGPNLGILVNVLGPPFRYDVGLWKVLDDPISGHGFWAQTWNSDAVGIHGSDPGYIV